ncbi:MAG: efflux RND transporter periplasmic adaptor subunit [Candidatus Paceibacterota bacterium]|jgi:HlyD family secretion protein
MNILNKIKTYITKHKIISSVVLIAIIIIGIYLFSRNGKVTYTTSVVATTTLKEEVSVTGKVQASDSVNLAFERTGSVSFINAEVGDRVYRGQTIIALSNADLVADVAQKEASVKQAEAKLAELERGARPEELVISEIQVTSAKTNVGEAERSLADAISDAYLKSDDAIRNKVDQFFTNPRTANPQLIFQTDFQLESDIEQGRVVVEQILVNWLTKQSASVTYIDKGNTASKDVVVIQSFLDKVAFAVNGLAPSSNITQTSIDTWKAAVSLARTNVNSSASGLTNALDSLKTAQSALLVAESQLALINAGTATEQIAGQEAVLSQAKANVLASQAQLAKTILRSPLDGILTKQEAKYGQIVAAGSIIAGVISDKAYEIEGYIPEADIAKVHIGDEANVTLDAYGSEVLFKVSVTSIDPAETMMDGVATYKTIFTFTSQDERIRSGMTANIDIVTKTKEGVIAVPARAIQSKLGKKYVTILQDGVTSEVEVKLGIKASDGGVEIVSGLEVGDIIVISK